MAEATARPWRCSRSGSYMRDNYSQSWAIARVNGSTLIGGVFSDVTGGEEVTEANARLIVQAVNAHAALVDALRFIADSANGDYTTDGEQIKEMRERARAALALAGEK